MLNGVYIEKGLRPYLNKIADWKKPRFWGRGLKLLLTKGKHYEMSAEQSRHHINIKSRFLPPKLRFLCGFWG
jgi:hypothetical protein